MSVDEGDLPVPVFSGPYEEVLFLKSLLESADIETSIDGSVGARYSDCAPPGLFPRLLVRRRDVEAAMEFVEHFRKNGKRTTY